MIIWINGAFGSGKTQTAYELNKRLRNSFVYDPEEAGFYIRDNIPPELKAGDFQDYPMWREINNIMLKNIELNYDGIVIVPMTVTNKGYLRELKDGIENIQHVTLIASAETLMKRLRGRGERKNSWCIQQINRCVKSFEDEYFETRIITDDLSIDQVVEKIAATCNIILSQDSRSKLKKRMDRIFVWKKHIRFLK